MREVTLTDCFVSYLFGGANNVDNLTQIQMNVAGGKEAYEAAQRRQEQEAAEAAAEADEDDNEEADDDAPSKRLVIDRLTVSGVRVKLQMLTIPVPTITLTDLGKTSGGVTLAELTAQVWDAILKGASSVGDGAAALGGLINATAGSTVDGVKQLGDGVKQLGDDAKKTADSLRQMFKGFNKGK